MALELEQNRNIQKIESFNIYVLSALIGVTLFLQNIKN